VKYNQAHATTNSTPISIPITKALNMIHYSPLSIVATDGRQVDSLNRFHKGGTDAR